jgi:hypothetical protein
MGLRYPGTLARLSHNTTEARRRAVAGGQGASEALGGIALGGLTRHLNPAAIGQGAARDRSLGFCCASDTELARSQRKFMV